VVLERARMVQVSTAQVPQPDDARDALVYLTLQELATRVSHRNTGKLIGDPVGYDLMSRVASDENLHHLFYRDVTAAAIELDPSGMVQAIERQVAGFAMPGVGIPDFDRHAALIARAGIYDFAVHHDQILTPVVLRQWRVAELTGLDDAGEASRDRLLRQIERYASSVGCRHRHLSEYFGDRYEKDACGGCDYCLNELEPAVKPVELARKILSCVARVGQRFGATHVASVLRGQASEQVVARGHDQLSTFGLLPDASNAEVRGYIEQLIGAELLQQSDGVYPVVALTQKGLALLKDPACLPGLALARQRPPRKGAPRMQSRVEAESWENVDRDLFERLRSVRLEIARSRGVPPYVIFHDATLREMARLRPTSIDALLAVKGVGARKADDLGGVFLDAIRAHA
jgi:hypothetical protein